jgi:hypothetical protein
MALQYLTDDKQGYLKSAEQLKSHLIGSPGRFGAGAELCANLELGNVTDAERLLEESPARENGPLALLFAIAWHQAGDTAKASQWRQRAIVALETADADSRRAADLLGSVDINLDDLDDVLLQRIHKAALVIVLAALHAEKRTALLTLAEKLNQPGLFPYGMLKRAIDEMKP